MFDCGKLDHAFCSLHQTFVCPASCIKPAPTSFWDGRTLYGGVEAEWTLFESDQTVVFCNSEKRLIALSNSTARLLLYDNAQNATSTGRKMRAGMNSR